jgi:hypothetical protein
MVQVPLDQNLASRFWTYAELAIYLCQTQGIAVSETTMRTFCTKHGVRSSRPTYQYRKGGPDKQAVARQELDTLKKVDADELVLLSQDEARFSLIPTLRITLGVKGHRPLAGNWDGHPYLYLFGTLNLVTGHLTTRLVERPRQTRISTVSKRQSLQAAFANHLRDIAPAYPATHSPPGRAGRRQRVLASGKCH